MGTYLKLYILYYSYVKEMLLFKQNNNKPT